MLMTQKINKKETTQNHGFLRWSQDSHTEERVISHFISIGREKSNIISIEDHYLSRQHFRIQKKNNSDFMLQDLNSRNGTFLNGNRILTAVLKNNDRIQAGQKNFIFSFERYNESWKIHTESKNPEWNEQLKTLPNLAQSDMPVLITGPSGTGKEMLAKLIHRFSQRGKGPMISINCSALSETLIESEFFGHIKGSYTGAQTNRKGAFMAAEGGSLFLDEIGDLSLNLQPKLLRALENQEIKAVGSDKIQKANVRIIAATHQDLKSKTEEKTFRSDLYFRLNILNLSPPPLSKRMEDFNDLLALFCSKYDMSFSEKTIQFLKRWEWPGNIRELKNTVARAKALFSGMEITEEKLPHLISDSNSLSKKENTTILQSLRTSEIQKIEKNLILKTLSQFNGQQKKAAQELNVPLSTLAGKIKKYNINPKNFKCR